MENKIYKYGKNITWSIPILFENEPIWGAIYKNFLAYGITLPQVNVFGCPAHPWGGGRNPYFCQQINKESLTKVFKYLLNINATPSLTFTNTALTKEDLYDPYANYFLDIALEAKAHFIVYSDILKNYIKEKNPNAYVISSVIKPTFEFHGIEKMKEWSIEKESAFYNKLLKEYDLVVVRPEFSKGPLLENPSLIDDISRIEVLINQHCIQNCPQAPAHYKALSALRYGGNANFKCYKCNFTNRVMIYNNTVSHDEDAVKKLVSYGVKHLKLQGRSCGNLPQSHALMLFGQMFNTTGSNHLIVEDIMHGAIESEITYFNETYISN